MQSFQSPQYMHDSPIDRATRVRTLIAGEDSPTPQRQYVSPYSIQVVEVIDEDEDAEEAEEVEEAGFRAIIEPRSERADEGDEEDQVDDTALPELSVNEVQKLGLPSVPTTWQPMDYVPEEPMRIVNLPHEFYIAAQRAGEEISEESVVASNCEGPPNEPPIDLTDRSERQVHISILDRQEMGSLEGCRSGWDLPLRIFLLFFSLPIFELLAANTNLYAIKHDANGIHQTGRYAGRKKRLWRDTSAGELMIWIGLVIYMGVFRQRQPCDIWRRDSEFPIYTISSFMPRARWEQLKRYFHISSPAIDNVREHLYAKIEPLTNALGEAFRRFVVPG